MWRQISDSLKACAGFILNKPTSLGVMIAVPLVVASFYALLQPRHLNRVLGELSSLRQIRGVPMPKHDGTQLLFGQTTEKGVGAYLYDISAGTRKLLHETRPGEIFGSIGWSPDDKYFAFLAGSNIEIFQADTGILLTSLRIRSDGFVGGMWMSNDSILFWDQSSFLYRASMEDLYWSAPKRFRMFDGNNKSLGGNRQNYTALNGREAAWRIENVFWCADAEARSPRKLFEIPREIKILSATYNEKAARFLLSCEDGGGRFLATVPISGGLQRVDATGDVVGKQLAWRGLDGYICGGKASDGRIALLTRSMPKSSKVRLEWSILWTISAGDNAMYVVGAQGAEPTAIWQYEFASGSSRPIVLNSDFPFKYTRFVEPEGFETLTAGREQISFNLYAPAKFSSKKKYPLVICEGPRNYEQIVANAGAFCASVAGLGPEGRPRPEDYLAVYDALKDHPNIDLEKVCLMGSSKGIRYMLDVLENRNDPRHWNSAILLSSSPLLNEKSSLNVRRLLIDYGGSDLKPKDQKILESFQDRVSANGKSVLLIRHPGEGHTLNSVSADNRRKQAIANFVADLD